MHEKVLISLKLFSNLQTAREYNLHRSLFTRIQETFEKIERNVVKTLDTQYRMHPEIVKFPNAYFYRNRMVTDVTVLHDFKMIPYAVFGLEYCQTSTQTLYNVYNLNEAMFVTRLLRQMQELASPKQFSYGVITPYDRHRKEVVKQLQ
jgi:senataxin